jgi:hypothetical protein
LLDLYKPPSNASNRTAPKAIATRGTRKVSGQGNNNTIKTLEDDESNWIHRDKLAQIESRELEEAGLRVGRRTSEAALKREEKRQRLASPVRIEGDLEGDESNTAEESLSTPPKSLIPKPNSGRSSSSRIPIPRSLSSPTTNGDSNAIGTRSRNGSFGVNNELEESPQSIRSRKASYLDDDDLQGSPPDTPPRTNTSSTTVDRLSASPQKKTAVKTVKKSPAPRAASNTKQRNVTPARQTSEPKRPGTSSGATPRPSTSHRPEGDPPWLATMYKPDPRLPPDQQMLPTHAKRLAQEQWEKEGKTGTVYDREFRLLNTEPFPENLQPLPEPNDDNGGLASITPAKDELKTTVLTTKKWSLSQTPPLDSPRSATGSFRPGTSDTHGGYRTTPTIMKSPTPNVQNPPLAIAPIQVMDLPEDEGEPKKKGCTGCGCVVM